MFELVEGNEGREVLLVVIVMYCLVDVLFGWWIEVMNIETTVVPVLCIHWLLVRR